MSDDTSELGTSRPWLRVMNAEIERHGGVRGTVKLMGHHDSPPLWTIHPSHRPRVVRAAPNGADIPPYGNINPTGRW
jgi:hypothetical protein